MVELTSAEKRAVEKRVDREELANKNGLIKALFNRGIYFKVDEDDYEISETEEHKSGYITIHLKKVNY